MKKDLKEIAKLFFKLGAISFGGPAAHISLMEREVVQKRKWISEQHFLDLIGATNIIPGPNSTEMTMHCGHEKAGWRGLFVAGATFIIPAVLITMLFSWFYKEYSYLPNVEKFIYGIKPAVISIMIMSLISLGKKALKTKQLLIIGSLSFIACLFGLNEISAIFISGVIGLLLYLFKKNKNGMFTFIPMFSISISSLKTFWVFLKIGSLLYGGGYVLFAFLDAELVSEGIISRTDLINAVAVGQFTPGPILSTATFIGWQIGGFFGALAATLGIFLPSFIFVLLLNPIVPKLRKSISISSFLDAVSVAAVSIILVVLVRMVGDVITDWKSILIALISLILALKFKKLNSAIIVIGGAFLGYLLAFI
ncbi:chromate efflux transporter [Crocinitomicaceae bacterium]|nr:chromate efflux transporter [Crocinitomicaceae bacterium]